MQIAFYKAPGTLADRVIRLVARSKYSHCELVINGTCCSSSIRDGGVRLRSFWLDPDKWDVVDVPGDVDAALAWFTAHEGEKYDWFGAFRFALFFLPQISGRWFCSEACASALGLSAPWSFSPQDLYVVFGDRHA